ncbi:cbb3-type cytochrome oxidase maturation protein [Sphingobacterium alimentarium]|uniref:Cbb3-type cytochrome oxidase maturation protein n=1 Tax=Sphingobacterium alimentarium TaxID=797292 RepID=A0A4R3VLJ8_9SPHI|nr:cbb3-type cytochrome oxidase assembly protein CcoS [Sphingobacterium alimentarium]TCV07281.1 cbb3-type cytochrome oxidase maturation protein [Sphingobacterium alimentarium]
MNIIFLLIGFSVLIALIFLGAFFWANKTKQYEDTYTPSVRILFDDEVKEVEQIDKLK